MGNYSVNKIDKETGEITGTMNLEVRAYPIAEPKGNVKGYASVTVDGMFGIHGISVMDGKNGLFASMPQARDSDGKYRDVAHPVTSEGRKALNDAVLTEHGIALDALVAEKESTLAKIREGAEAAKKRAAEAKDVPEAKDAAEAKGASGKETGKKGKDGKAGTDL